MHLDDNPELARENKLVLYVVQALLGMITANFIAVSVRFGSERLLVNFWLLIGIKAKLLDKVFAVHRL